jgi:hypothetical protein
MGQFSVAKPVAPGSVLSGNQQRDGTEGNHCVCARSIWRTVWGLTRASSSSTFVRMTKMTLVGCRDMRKRPARRAQRNAKRPANGMNKTNILPQAKGSVGRPPHEPNDKDRDFVITMVAHGVGHDEIARVIGISDVTLRKYYNEVLETGLVRAHAAVGHSLFLNAVGGVERDWTKANMRAAEFYARTRMRWVEPPREFEIPDLRIESLSDRQIDILLERVLARRRADIEGRAETSEGERGQSVRRLPS